MASNNFMIVTGPFSCIRCDFKTDESLSYDEQTIVMHAHLDKVHPDWQTDGGASILPNRLPKSDAERIAQLEAQLADARKAATWVSVEDSMPTVIGREFWCWVVPSAGIKTTDETIVRLDFEPHLRAAETYLSKSGGIRFNCGCLEEVTHWMEKPAPPITAPQEEKKAHDHRD